MFLEKVEYGSIFDARGASYHAAMEHLPDARVQEFRLPLERLDLSSGQVIVDLPAGGGYLSRFLPNNVEYVCVESSQVFFKFCQSRGLTACLMENDRVALADNSADRLVSVAGVHHIENKPALFSEMKRILKTNGKISLADVEADSAVARFLDEFVGMHTPTGHQGLYLTDTTTKSELFGAGFKNVESARLKYHWQFSTIEHLVWYCKKIFALEASDSDVLDGLETFLGVERKNDAVLLPWQLLNFVATA